MIFFPSGTFTSYASLEGPRKVFFCLVSQIRWLSQKEIYRFRVFNNLSASILSICSYIYIQNIGLNCFHLKFESIFVKIHIACSICWHRNVIRLFQSICYEKYISIIPHIFSFIPLLFSVRGSKSCRRSIDGLYRPCLNPKRYGMPHDLWPGLWLRWKDLRKFLSCRNKRCKIIF